MKAITAKCCVAMIGAASLLHVAAGTAADPSWKKVSAGAQISFKPGKEPAVAGKIAASVGADL